MFDFEEELADGTLFEEGETLWILEECPERTTKADSGKNVLVQCIRTTVFHPSSNEMVERMHRPLKQVLMFSKIAWFEALPLALLGLRTVLREDTMATAAELTRYEFKITMSVFC
ncbi:hypothetical protein AVEN_234943-1 [Araneus ventricosus]|uniref:Integrase catalytic domain-containing protein n=1 Tax=Araneus ventricosus TaxID=182803 RepID=A0A4Y2Q3A7_ARAVE|nr:hypothetical protein AVEN_234943-1 [Araneus ventricosus]